MNCRPGVLHDCPVLNWVLFLYQAQGFGFRLNIPGSWISVWLMGNPNRLLDKFEIQRWNSNFSI
jgi:hypothetical protein